MPVAQAHRAREERAGNVLARLDITARAQQPRPRRRVRSPDVSRLRRCAGGRSWLAAGANGYGQGCLGGEVLGPRHAVFRGPEALVARGRHSIDLTMSSTTFFASPNTIIVLSM